MINIFIQLYIALFIMVIWHEIGHFGKIKFPYFPLPIAYAENSKSLYGGLLFDSIAFISIWYFKPQLFFIQMVGLLSFLHFLHYTIMGGLGIREWIIKMIVPKYLLSGDIQKGNIIAIILGIISVLLFGEYYIKIFIVIIKMIMYFGLSNL